MSFFISVYMSINHVLVSQIKIAKMIKMMLLASTINHQQTFAIPIKLTCEKNLELQPTYIKQETFHLLCLFFFNETDKIFNFEVVFSIQIWIYTVLQFPILLPVTGPTPHVTITYSFCCLNLSFLLQRLSEHKVEYVKNISYWLLIPGIEWGYKPFQLYYFI